MDILIERDVRLVGAFWDRTNRMPYNVVQANVHPWGVASGMVCFLLVLTFVYGEDLLFPALFFGIWIAIVLIRALRRRRKWMQRLVRRCGDRMTMFIRFTDEQVVIGARDQFMTTYAWPVLIEAKVVKRRLEMVLGGDQIIVDLTPLSEAQVAELQRHIRTVLGDGADVCPKCSYDLRATEGATCPECGAAVRHIATPEAATLRSV